MNGEIPSVPITTLAGIASLTDLLPEMPLPSPLPQTLSNKSLLFHPRVAEEAHILLSLRDENLVPQLVTSLVQTSAEHIELKDHYAGTEQPVDQQQNVPELLKAILQWNPSVFKGPPNNNADTPVELGSPGNTKNDLEALKHKMVDVWILHTRLLHQLIVCQNMEDVKTLFKDITPKVRAILTEYVSTAARIKQENRGEPQNIDTTNNVIAKCAPNNMKTTCTIEQENRGEPQNIDTTNNVIAKIAPNNMKTTCTIEQENRGEPQNIDTTNNVIAKCAPNNMKKTCTIEQENRGEPQNIDTTNNVIAKCAPNNMKTTCTIEQENRGEPQNIDTTNNVIAKCAPNNMKTTCTIEQENRGEPQNIDTTNNVIAKCAPNNMKTTCTIEQENNHCESRNIDTTNDVIVDSAPNTMKETSIVFENLEGRYVPGNASTTVQMNNQETSLDMGVYMSRLIDMFLEAEIIKAKNESLGRVAEHGEEFHEHIDIAKLLDDMSSYLLNLEKSQKSNNESMDTSRVVANDEPIPEGFGEFLNKISSLLPSNCDVENSNASIDDTTDTPVDCIEGMTGNVEGTGIFSANDANDANDENDANGLWLTDKDNQISYRENVESDYNTEFSQCIPTHVPIYDLENVTVSDDLEMKVFSDSIVSSINRNVNSSVDNETNTQLGDDCVDGMTVSSGLSDDIDGKIKNDVNAFWLRKENKNILTDNEEMVDTGHDNEEMVETGHDNEEMVDTGHDNEEMVETGHDNEEMVETGHDNEEMVETGHDNEEMVETGHDNEEMVETGHDNTPQFIPTTLTENQIVNDDVKLKLTVNMWVDDGSNELKSDVWLGAMPHEISKFIEDATTTSVPIKTENLSIPENMSTEVTECIASSSRLINDVQEENLSINMDISYTSLESGSNTQLSDIGDRGMTREISSSISSDIQETSICSENGEGYTFSNLLDDIHETGIFSRKGGNIVKNGNLLLLYNDSEKVEGLDIAGIGQPVNSPCPPHWNTSPGSSQVQGQAIAKQIVSSPSYPSSRHAPQGSPAAAACARLPAAAPHPHLPPVNAAPPAPPEISAQPVPPSFICDRKPPQPTTLLPTPFTDADAVSKPVQIKDEPGGQPQPPANAGFPCGGNKYPPDSSDSVPPPPSSIPRAHAPLMPGSSPAQASTAPVSQIKEDFEKRGATPDPKIKEPVVRLNRLSAEDFIRRSQRSACAQKSPSPMKNDVKNHTPVKMTSGSESEEEEPRSKNKYFKNREREREILRKKEKDQKKKSNQDEDYSPDEFDVSLSERIKKRKRNNRVPAVEDDDNNACPTEEVAAPPKTKLRKLERKLVPVLEKLSIEELMETNTYQRFNRTIEKIFDNTDDLDVSMDNEDDDSPALIQKYLLEELYTEAAKLKTHGAMESIPSEKLIRLLSILEKNIRHGAKVSPIGDPDDDEDERKLFMELTMDRVMRAVDASLTTLYILTSPNMHKRVYLEDVIDRVVIFTKFQLHNTIYPAFDPVYRVDPKSKDGYMGSAKKKRAHAKEVREKSVLTLYNKLIELVALLSELLNIQTLTDTAVLHASSMGISPFFVEGVSELQLSALKLVTTIFMKYEKHRKLLLDDILASMARLPSSKRSLRSYRVSSEEYIQMLTALVLQLIQCMVILPHNLDAKPAQGQNSVDPDVVIVGMFSAARHTANNFLYVFLAKCSSKSEEIDYRPLFENFVQDLLTTVNKPEWPAAELMLSVLGALLVANFVNKGLEMSLRVASLDYLGVVAARLRKDAVQSNLRLSMIDQIIEEIKTEENKDDDGNIRGEVRAVESDDERIQFLQRVLLDYLAVKGQDEPACIHARHFYLAQWYQDNSTTKNQSPNTPKQNKANHKFKKNSKRKKKESSDEEMTSSEEEDDEEGGKKSNANANGNTDDPMDAYRVVEAKKKFLLSKIRPFQDPVTNDGVRPQILQTYIDYNSAELVARYLASKRPFSQSFDTYLKHILKVLTEQSVLIRTKAMKCLTMIVEVDSDVLASKDMTIGVNTSFLDHSTSVREAAVDLVGKYVHSRPDLINNYYDMLSERILDTGVSVRKRVIKIMKDICIGCPEYPKIPEICVKMIRRVNDEDGIRKLVMEVFQNMWFTPVSERPTTDTQALIRKVMNITDVVAASKDMGLEWFEQLLLSLFKPKEDKEDSRLLMQEPPKALLLACKQIVDCLIDNVIRLDGRGGGSSQRLIACMVTLFLFSKIRPQLLVDHAITLQPYLSLKCKTQGDYQIISYVAKILELVVPLIEHPSETFLARLEEDSVKLIMIQDQVVIQSCASCLGSVVNNVTRNFKLIRDCLKKCYEHMCQVRTYLETAARNNTAVPDEALMAKQKPIYKRAIFVVGVLLRYFDLNDDAVRGDQLPKNITLEIFELFYFLLNQDEDIQLFTMKAIGNVCIRHYDLMLGPVLKTLYHQLLKEDDAPLTMKVQVLKNIEIYLQEEERRMIKQDQEWAKMSKKENLKEMGDVSSGMASTIIQLYLKEILVSFLHPDVNVRRSALQVIQLILSQGLVHPIMIVPYLVCMSTDNEKMVSNSADKQLQEIEKKYPGFIHMKAQAGIKLSFQLQKILQMGSKVVRGFRTKEGEVPGALNGYLYSILRTKQQKRALILSILQQFDEQQKTSLSQMLYLADNMAYLPYQVQDEPLFIIHQIDIMISVTGTNLLQSFREALIPTATPQVQIDPMTGEPIPQAQIDEEEDEDEDALLSRVPEDTHYLQECLTASQGCLLLLVLKQHLKTTYGFNDSKITQYSPAESTKAYEKAVNRKSNARFNPKVTVQKIQQGSPPNLLDENARRALVSEYLEFKHLMMNLDPDEPDDEDDNHTPQKSSQREHRDRTSGAHAASQSTPDDANSRVVDPGLGQSPVKTNSHLQPHMQPTHNSPHQVEPQTLRVPKLTIVPPKPPEKHHHHHHRSHKTRKTDRHKKHHHKRKKSKLRSSDDSEHEYSDPDFLV